MVRDHVCFYLRLIIVSTVFSFFENSSLVFQPTSVVARAVEYIVAITFVDSIACGSDSH